ncbi:beta-galactosidase [Pelagicoccus sp. SDUM812005]|uniref:beta-galactosidase n=1 Tax=Pelagicoccus sp. SDUM812005 TaxID=3041257 RepID=UPI00280FAEDF|nr:beta-galactosidase [Pelagicoccus sp. SDUM812005]MDQ8179602.1 beta-galactosidase [Pelagicoccus sp. SDUM812005]
MKFGVQYYPSQWPESQWAADVAKMKQAGVKYVRMGDLSWSAFEPKPGQLDFSWMERAIALLGDAGIRTILCTCSRTPPPWLYRRRPEMLPVDPQGVVRYADGRYAVAMAHPSFVEEARRIDEAMISHFAGNENIVAWQVDNEIGCHTDCYCDHCMSEFHRYLERKYKTPEALNEAWGEHFWAFSIERFEDVPRPFENPHIKLEYRKFLSSLNVEFAASRRKLMKAADPDKPVTTNFQNLYWAHTDYHALSDEIDVNGMNHYPARTPELALDCLRGDKGEVWVLEQQTHLPAIDSPPGWMRLWAWMAIAHGASALIFFRWRQCRYGCEQFGDGLLPHSGRESRFFREFAAMGAELGNLAGLIEPTRPRAEVAITYGYDSRWAVEASVYPKSVDPVEEAIGLHKGLSQVVTAIDALDPRADLSGYRLVVAPRLWLVDEAIATNLRRFVEAGGTLCLTAGSGVVDEFGKCFEEPRPGRLSEIAGMWSSDFVASEDLDLSLESDCELDGLGGGVLADEIHVEGAEVVARHGKGWRKGMPALTRHRFGKGALIYLGLRLDDEAMLPFAKWLTAEAGVEQRFERQEGVTVYERVCESYRLLFLLNWTDYAKRFPLDAGWRDARTDEAVGESVEIAGNDLRLLKREASTEGEEYS